MGHPGGLHPVHDVKHDRFPQSAAAMVGMGAALLAPQVSIKITDEP